ncbi:HyaD/HybD family hydrogenase maturation endopeptidase [Paraburkholderia dinghuensis]|uniref:HyaD/HybD family hydrogenase maturation endopeptidase n=1 Tax=Paraburkholderia dinghuensis TaxID=2305225 RepID=A0A3N6MTE8_9BURK|nr:HyaD/HybD family hydrogenase maturation endopeptidase [Paraburkholderia dinghuensis]RQH07068.1 HyaD/HybD family hydrogenase maturation endopeptidase [Paraburkholderia dinghuensis]
MADRTRIVVLGIGNVLWADEGFGVRAVERLNALWRWPDNVELVDGGTQGLALLPFVESADRLIVLDAVDFGLEPGTLDVREGDAVPACLNARKMSLHQAGFSDVLACAQLKGHYPAELVLIGVQPVELDDFGGSLRPAVRAQIEPAVAVACEWLRRWGALPIARDETDAPAAPLNASGLSLSRYEDERPSEQRANRQGDTRFWHPPEQT